MRRSIMWAAKAVQVLAACFLLCLPVLRANADEYLVRSATIFCPFAAGGATGILARMLGQARFIGML